jgi:hypothetical protein
MWQPCPRTPDRRHYCQVGDPEIELTADPAPADIQILKDGLERFNQQSAFGADRA